jgi:hypothetical protein
MYAAKLHTSQYRHAEPLLLLRARTRLTCQRTLLLVTTMATVGMLAWCGSAVANADNNREQQACEMPAEDGWR